MTAVTWLQVAAQTALNFVMSLNPITWIIIGIVALIAIFVLLWNKCEGFRNFFIAMWEGIKAAAIAVWDFLWNNLIKPYINMWINIINFVVGVFVLAWEGIKWVANWLYVNVLQPIGGFFSWLGGVIGNALVAAWDWIVSVWNAVSSWFDTYIIQPISGFFTTLGTAISGAFSKAWNFIVGVWDAVSSWFQDTVITPVTNVFNSVKEAITNAFSSAWDTVKALWDKAVGFFKGIGDAIGKAFNFITGKGKEVTGLNTFAGGVTNFGGGMAIVGEKGPELVNLPRGSDVIPNDKSKELIGGLDNRLVGLANKGANSVNNNFNIDVKIDASNADGATLAGLEQKIKGLTREALEQAFKLLLLENEVVVV
jgi:phage-related protein